MRRGASAVALLDRALAAGAVLVLPLALLLFAQWPLRDLVQAGSREANDLAQILFALYVGLAVTAATRAGAHLAADAFAHRYRAPTRRVLDRAAALLVLLPWSLGTLWLATPSFMQSVRQLEAFPDTFDPGYFLVRLGVMLLLALVALQSLLTLLRPAARQ